jgi:hypothetical protein
MVTERTTEGAGLRLEKRLRITESELTLGESLLCVGNWFKDKSQNSNRIQHVILKQIKYV